MAHVRHPKLIVGRSHAKSQNDTNLLIKGSRMRMVLWLKINWKSYMPRLEGIEIPTGYLCRPILN